MSAEDEHHVDQAGAATSSAARELESELEARELEARESESDPTAPPGVHSLGGEVGTDPCVVLQRSRYPLNSRKLTVAHLHAVAEAIGLPTAGSADQLRQCIEGRLRTDRDNPNIVVIVRDIEQILSLADSEDEFVRTPPLRRGPSLQHDQGTLHELQEVREQLQEAERIIKSAKSKDLQQARQIAELHEALTKQEQHSEELADRVTSLTKQLLDSKARLRENWRTSCEHLAEQDTAIAEKDAVIVDLKHKLDELMGDRQDGRDSRTSCRRTATPRTETPPASGGHRAVHGHAVVYSPPATPILHLQYLHLVEELEPHPQLKVHPVS